MNSFVKLPGIIHENRISWTAQYLVTSGSGVFLPRAKKNYLFSLHESGQIVRSYFSHDYTARQWRGFVLGMKMLLCQLCQCLKGTRIVSFSLKKLLARVENQKFFTRRHWWWGRERLVSDPCGPNRFNSCPSKHLFNIVKHFQKDAKFWMSKVFIFSR